MRSVAVVLTVGILAAALILNGCGGRDSAETADSAGQTLSGGQVGIPSAAPSGHETVDEMIEQWKAIAATSSVENPMLEEAAELAAQIAAREPRALLSLLNIVDDGEVSPFAKILATLSLKSVMGPHTADRVIAMTKPDKEPTTRACATSLLQTIMTNEATAALRQLKSDDEPRVRLHAQIGLGMRDLNERRILYDMWRDPQVSIENKMSIIDALTSAPSPGDAAVMSEVAADQTIRADMRVLAIQALGQIGTAAHSATLSACLEDDSEEVRNAAKDALEDLNARMEGRGQITIPLQ